MQIYEVLKGLISKEQLEEFQAEVKNTVDEAIEKRKAEVEAISEQYVNEAVKEQVSKIEEKLKAEYDAKVQADANSLSESKQEVENSRTTLEAEYAEKESQLVDLYENKEAELAKTLEDKDAEVATLKESLEAEYAEKEKKLQEEYEEKESKLIELYEDKNDWLEEEYKNKVVELTEEHKAEIEAQMIEEGVVTKEKFEQFRQMFEEKEEHMVDALNKFLDEQIASKISDKLIRESVVSEEMTSLVEGIKMLFEEHYSGIDTTAGIRKIREENEALKESYERLVSEKADLSQKLESAATRILITEKTQDLSDVQREKVTTYFEGRDFDFVKDRIDNFILLTENENQSSKKALRSERRIQRLDEVNSGCLPEKKPTTKDTDLMNAISKYM